MLPDLGGRALGDLAAEVERHDLVRDQHDHLHVMLDQQDRELTVVAKGPDLMREVLNFGVVEAVWSVVALRRYGVRSREE